MRSDSLLSGRLKVRLYKAEFFGCFGLGVAKWSPALRDVK
jgi:hypothetical protein